MRGEMMKGMRGEGWEGMCVGGSARVFGGFRVGVEFKGVLGVWWWGLSGKWLGALKRIGGLKVGGRGTRGSTCSFWF